MEIFLLIVSLVPGRNLQTERPDEFIVSLKCPVVRRFLAQEINKNIQNAVLNYQVDTKSQNVFTKKMFG